MGWRERSRLAPLPTHRPTLSATITLMDEGSQTGAQPQDGQNLYQPDQVITPSIVSAEPTTPDVTPETATEPAISQGSPQPPVALNQTAPEQNPPSAPTMPNEPAPQNDQGVITWTASEFIANQKSSRWYALLAIGAVVIGALVLLLTRDLFPTIAVLLGVVLLGVYAGRQPREQSYALDDHGLTVGTRHYAYHEFRSFAVVPDGAFVSIELAPLKTFCRRHHHLRRPQ